MTDRDAAFSTRSAFDARPNRLTVRRRALVAADRAPIDLTVSNPTRAGLPYAAEAITAAFADARNLTYAPTPFGLPEARAAVAREVGVEPRQVVLTASTSEAYGWLFKLLCDPGDGVLAPRPSYPLFDQLARFESVRLVDYPLAYDGAWHLDLARLRAAATADCRAILVVSPNNPTGQMLKRDELAGMASLGLPIVADEVFADYVLGSTPDAVPARSATDALVFTLGGLSKAAGLPQMKVGWIVVTGPPARVEAALSRLELIADTWLSVSTPAQHALPALLKARAVTVEAIRRRLQRNLDGLRRAVVDTPVSVLPADGGWYAVLAVPRIADDETWALRLLDEGVYVQPGFFYDFADDGHLVVSLLTPEGPFAEGIGRLVRAVERACR